ncbi:unnamed protein product, partial [Amoebophrya sp. A120]
RPRGQPPSFSIALVLGACGQPVSGLLRAPARGRGPPSFWRTGRAGDWEGRGRFGASRAWRPRVRPVLAAFFAGLLPSCAKHERAFSTRSLYFDAAAAARRAASRNFSNWAQIGRLYAPCFRARMGVVFRTFAAPAARPASGARLRRAQAG